MSTVPAIVARARGLVEPALRAAVGALGDEQMRLVAGYQLGWWEADGTPVSGGGGKAIRPALAILSAEAAGDPAAGVPGAVAVELVHNFSLLHDDIMDRDVERRHRPTGWVVFGEGQAILAGNAMLTAAIEVLLRDGARSRSSLPLLMSTVQELISGQSRDLALERRQDATVDDVVRMEHGKTAALISCSAAIGAQAAGAAHDVVDALAEYGQLVGLAFQLVDDVLGITGDPAVTGKSASSDLRAGKRSAPVVAALSAGGDSAGRLAELLAGGPLQSEEQIALGVRLIEDAGGIRWANAEAERLLDAAAKVLRAADLPEDASAQFERMSAYLVRRAR
ncbi:polyprenyl synthetase family protein [uncultured Jatrophihabitans sp.]|uniref:polyprenyl synthetase family protein n=1 Tax=uncultured Jatrophihabitans sp. TaxID=1610747 RepID=UPI0035CC4D07